MSYLYSVIHLALSRSHVYLEAVPAVAEVMGMVILFYLARAVIKHDTRIKHSALLEQGRYKVSFDREKPKEYNAEKFFQNQQGLWIHYCVWKHKTFPNFPKAVILVFHGHSEHVNRHAHVAEYLADQNYLVVGIDHQGFGRSEGDRGHVESFEHYLDDAILFLSEILPDLPVIEKMEKSGLNYKTLPLFFVSHSMGSLISLATAFKLQKQGHKLMQKLKGVVVGSPPLYLDPRTRKPLLVFLLKLLAYLFPKLPFFGFPAEESTSFSQVKMHSRFDPLNYQDKIRPLQLVELLDKNKYIIDHAEEFDVPILLFHGTEDPTCKIDGSRSFVEKVKCKDKKLLELEGLKHEPMQERKAIRTKLFKEIAVWLDARV